ncbi:MAG: GIY-YIG nuclease family protein, partial [Candidatus Omnitrophota bacterium]
MNMHFVYMLQSENFKYLYIGRTNDVKRRLKEHNSGRVLATSKQKPLRVVYYESYLNKKDAFDREMKLKHHGSTI